MRLTALKMATEHVFPQKRVRFLATVQSADIRFQPASNLFLGAFEISRFNVNW